MIKTFRFIIILSFFGLNANSQLDNSSWLCQIFQDASILLEVEDDKIIMTRFNTWDSIMIEQDTIPKSVKRKSVKIQIDGLVLKFRLKKKNKLSYKFKEYVSNYNLDENDSIICEYKKETFEFAFHRLEPNANHSKYEYSDWFEKSRFLIKSQSSEQQLLDFISRDKLIIFWPDDNNKTNFQINDWLIYQTIGGQKLLIVSSLGYLKSFPILGIKDNEIMLKSLTESTMDDFILKKLDDSESIDTLNSLYGTWELATIDGIIPNPKHLPPLPPYSVDVDTSNFLSNFRYIFNRDSTYTWKNYFRQNSGKWKQSISGDYIILDSDEVKHWDDRDKILVIENLDTNNLVIRQYYTGILPGRNDFVSFEFRKITTPNNGYSK